MLDPKEVRKDGFRASADRHHDKLEREAASRNGKTPPSPTTPSDPVPDDVSRAALEADAETAATPPVDPGASAS